MEEYEVDISKIKAYDDEAHAYEERRRESFGGELWWKLKPKIVMKEIEKQFEFKENVSVLDACCGTGRFTFPLSEKFNKIVALDMSEGMLKTLSEIWNWKISGGYSYGDIEMIHGNIESLTFKKDSFELITCMRALMHIPKYKQALQELVRVLASNGLLIFNIPIRGWRYRIMNRFRKRKEDTNRIKVEEIDKLMESLGCEVIKKRGIFWIVTLTTSHIPKKLTRMFEYIERFADWIMPAKYASEVIFFVRKR